MKKIIAAFDGLRFSDSTLTYSLELTGPGTRLIGLFLEDPYTHGYVIDDLLGKPEGSLAKRKKQLDRIDAKTRAVSIRRFESACIKAGVNFSIRKQHHFTINELIEESQYSDLLVISSHEALRPHRKKEPTEFIHALLPEVRCPVLVVPATHGPLLKTVFLYDGKPSSMNALKCYSSLFPGLSGLAAEMISVYPSRKGAKLRGGSMLKEFMELHFPLFRVISLEGQVGHVLVKYLAKEEPGTCIVMGAYNRSKISRIFRPSLADRLLNKLELPLFIAHM